MAHRGGGPDGPIDVVWTLYLRLAGIVERLDRLAGSGILPPELGEAQPRPQLHVVEGTSTGTVMGGPLPQHAKPCDSSRGSPCDDASFDTDDASFGTEEGVSG